MWGGFIVLGGFTTGFSNSPLAKCLGSSLFGGFPRSNCWCLGTLEECEQFSDLCIMHIIEKVVPEEHFSSSELSGQFGTESHTNSELMQWPSWQQKYPGSSTSGWRFNFLKVILRYILKHYEKMTFLYRDFSFLHSSASTNCQEFTPIGMGAVEFKVA